MRAGDYRAVATALNRFRGFRHVVRNRNVYAYVLDPRRTRRIGELMDVLPGTLRLSYPAAAFVSTAAAPLHPAVRGGGSGRRALSERGASIDSSAAEEGD